MLPARFDMVLCALWHLKTVQQTVSDFNFFSYFCGQYTELFYTSKIEKVIKVK